NLLPWMTLMQTTPEQLANIARQIGQSRDSGLALQFAMLGGLRYDKSDLQELLARANPMITEEMIRESSAWELLFGGAVEQGRVQGLEQGRVQGLEQGLEQGREEGQSAGRIEEARHLVQRILGVRFPEIQAESEVSAIVDAEK